MIWIDITCLQPLVSHGPLLGAALRMLQHLKSWSATLSLPTCTKWNTNIIGQVEQMHSGCTITIHFAYHCAMPHIHLPEILTCFRPKCPSKLHSCKEWFFNIDAREAGGMQNIVRSHDPLVGISSEACMLASFLGLSRWLSFLRAVWTKIMEKHRNLFAFNQVQKPCFCPFYLQHIGALLIWKNIVFDFCLIILSRTSGRHRTFLSAPSYIVFSISPRPVDHETAKLPGNHHLDRKSRAMRIAVQNMARD